MEEFVHDWTKIISLCLEFIAALLMAVGAIEATIKLCRISIFGSTGDLLRRGIWLGFARWIILGLEFMMAADVVSTIVSPTWDEIGMLASIALIRTFLSYFMERDLEVANKNKESM
ncbi:DUF1622 domain-containing protein [Bdellovibrio sp. HCB288]|uniref:DUF1622 domain-containing protein n=1 Tax=Bdellovibrio sp. HCB288 TaxID=3394355 RepID=UPI0039B411C8